MRRFSLALAVIALLAVQASPALARTCARGKNSTAAMWLSILHPGIGEYYLKDWGPFFERAPQNKFWLGFIPGYGWPGYLQVRSAIDASRCRTLDRSH
jgi:hypothetical protein